MTPFLVHFRVRGRSRRRRHRRTLRPGQTGGDAHRRPGADARAKRFRRRSLRQRRPTDPRRTCSSRSDRGPSQRGLCRCSRQGVRCFPEGSEHRRRCPREIEARRRARGGSTPAEEPARPVRVAAAEPGLRGDLTGPCRACRSADEEGRSQPGLAGFGLVAFLGTSVLASARARADRGLSTANDRHVAARSLPRPVAATAATAGARDTPSSRQGLALQRALASSKSRCVRLRSRGRSS
jgi:hypothetical protein